jgi:hypothetical protein
VLEPWDYSRGWDPTYSLGLSMADKPVVCYWICYFMDEEKRPSVGHLIQCNANFNSSQERLSSCSRKSESRGLERTLVLQSFCVFKIVCSYSQCLRCYK